MTTPDTATLLEDAADRIADISRADIQIILRRAALRLRNAGAVSMEDDVEEALRDLASEFGTTRNDTIRFIVREWMEKNTYLPVHHRDEDGDVDGTARMQIRVKPSSTRTGVQFRKLVIDAIIDPEPPYPLSHVGLRKFPFERVMALIAVDQRH
ncbi:hypothetical protein ACVIGV_000882 [Rhizobium leguminosarum]